VIDGAMRLVSGSGAREASCLGAMGALTGWSVPTVNITGGLQSVPNAAAERLRDVRFNATVTAVMETQSGVAVSYSDAGGTQQQIDADGCVIAAMFHTACEIWPDLDRLAPDFRTRLRDVKLISITLGYRRTPN